MVSLADAVGAGDVPGDCVLVLSNEPAAAGLEKARARGISTAVVDHRGYGEDRARFEKALTEKVLEAGAEVVCLAGFMRVLTEEFVGRWQGRLLNIHPSLLPSFKGLHTHARVLEAGCAVHGCTVHEVTTRLDDGPIIGQAVVPVAPGEDEKILAKRVLKMEHRLYPAALAAFIRGDQRPILLSGLI